MFRRKLVAITLIITFLLSMVVAGCLKQPTEIEPVSIENLSEFDGEPGHFYLQEAAVDISFLIDYSGRFSLTDLFSMTDEQDDKIDFRVKREGDNQAIIQSPKGGYEKGATYTLTLDKRAYFSDEALKDARSLTIRIERDKIEKYEYIESVVQADTVTEIDDQTIDVKNVGVQVGDIISGENQNHEMVAYKIEKIGDDGTAQVSSPAIEEIYSDLQFTGEYNWNIDEIIANPDIKVQIADNFRKSGLYSGLVRAAYPKTDSIPDPENVLDIEVDVGKGSFKDSIKTEVSVTFSPEEQEVSTTLKNGFGPKVKLTVSQEISCKSKVNFDGILKGDLSVAFKCTSFWKLELIVSDEWKNVVSTGKADQKDQKNNAETVKSFVELLDKLAESNHQKDFKLFDWTIMVPALPGLSFNAQVYFFLDFGLSAEASMGQTTNTYSIAGVKINNTQIKPYSKTSETNEDFSFSVIGKINFKFGLKFDISAALFGEVLKVSAKLKVGLYLDLFASARVTKLEDLMGSENKYLYFEPGLLFEIKLEVKINLLITKINISEKLLDVKIPFEALTFGCKEIPLRLNVLGNAATVPDGSVIPPIIELEYYDVKKGLVSSETLNTNQLTYHILEGETEKKLKISDDSINKNGILLPEEYSDQELTIIARYKEDGAKLETQFMIVPLTDPGTWISLLTEPVYFDTTDWQWTWYNDPFFLKEDATAYVIDDRIDDGLTYNGAPQEVRLKTGTLLIPLDKKQPGLNVIEGHSVYALYDNRCVCFPQRTASDGTVYINDIPQDEFFVSKPRTFDETCDRLEALPGTIEVDWNRDGVTDKFRRVGKRYDYENPLNIWYTDGASGMTTNITEKFPYSYGINGYTGLSEETILHYDEENDQYVLIDTYDDQSDDYMTLVCFYDPQNIISSCVEYGFFEGLIGNNLLISWRDRNIFDNVICCANLYKIQENRLIEVASDSKKWFLNALIENTEGTFRPLAGSEPDPIEISLSEFVVEKQTSSGYEPYTLSKWTAIFPMYFIEQTENSGYVYFTLADGSLCRTLYTNDMGVTSIAGLPAEEAFYTFMAD